MIFRIFLTVIISVSCFATSIKTTKIKIQKNKIYISKMNYILDKLARKIIKKQNDLKKLNNQITILNNQIKNLNNELKNSNKILSNLNDLKKGYETKLKNVEDQIINFISENYFNTILKPDNINDLINKEVTEKLLEKYSKKIRNLIQENKQILSQINKINKQINSIKSKQNQLLKKKEQLALLLKLQKKELNDLKNEKLAYKHKLQKLLNEQKYLQNQLARLKIIQKKKKIPHIPSNFKPSTIKVKKYGSLYFRPRIASYHGPKTIPPVEGKIIKKFGPYIDPIYGLKLFNSSITIKPYKPNSVVRAIFSGKVVYIGNNDDKKIIILKHKHDLFSIYANLSKISPILKKGYYVKKGQIIARVKDRLEFEVTYKENPINPLKVINLKN